MIWQHLPERLFFDSNRVVLHPPETIIRRDLDVAKEMMVSSPHTIR